MNAVLKPERLDLPELPDSCASCAHFRSQAPSGVARCAAFPKGIPAAVMGGRNDHRQAIAGDGGIQWQQHPEWATATDQAIAELDSALDRGDLPSI